ncbi:unnamed protein product [Urochloa humidicola]
MSSRNCSAAAPTAPAQAAAPSLRTPRRLRRRPVKASGGGQRAGEGEGGVGAEARGWGVAAAPARGGGRRRRGCRRRREEGPRRRRGMCSTVHGGRFDGGGARLGGGGARFGRPRRGEEGAPAVLAGRALRRRRGSNTEERARSCGGERSGGKCVAYYLLEKRRRE